MPDEHCHQCYDCGDRFTTFRRRHHCRICGHIFCKRCCYQLIPGQFVGYSGDLLFTFLHLLHYCKCNMCLPMLSLCFEKYFCKVHCVMGLFAEWIYFAPGKNSSVVCTFITFLSTTLVEDNCNTGTTALTTDVKKNSSLTEIDFS